MKIQEALWGVQWESIDAAGVGSAKPAQASLYHRLLRRRR